MTVMASRMGGWPRLLILWAFPTRWVPRSFALFAKGRESEMPAPSGFDRVSTTKSNSTHSIAAHPFGKLRAGFCQKRKDGPPSVGMVQARIAKDGHPARMGHPS